MATGYEDIDRFAQTSNQMLDETLKRSNALADQSVEMETQKLARQKENIDRETVQQNRALYQDYKQASNPFGSQAENLAGQGLGNSGYAESTYARMYNTYQNNITSTLNTARQLKSDVDFQIQQAIQQGNITKGQNAIQLYNQRMQLLAQEYEMRNNRRQFLYQQEQDKIAQNNWKEEFGYKKKQDKQAQKNWEKEFGLKNKEFEWQKKKSASSSRSSGSSGSSRKKSSGKKKSSGTTNSINLNDSKKNVPTPKEIISNIKTIQGPGIEKNIKDGISGKTFKSLDSLLNYYGYAGVSD